MKVYHTEYASSAYVADQFIQYAKSSKQEYNYPLPAVVLGGPIVCIAQIVITAAIPTFRWCYSTEPSMIERL